MLRQGKTRNGSSAGHKPPSAQWAKLLRQIPAYDPIDTAAGAWFDPVLAERMLDFFPECLHHIEGDLYGQPFVLQPWQQAIIANLFGWQRLDSQGRQVRRYGELFLYVPRKDGKTPLVAGLGLAVLYCDDERGQQNYVAAGEREQAGNLFRYCKGMVELEPRLKNRCRIYGGNAAAGQAKSIVIEDEYSFLRVISSDADTKHGGTTHLAIVDELHVQTSRNLVDVLRTSTASSNRKQTLMVSVTTADFDRPSICNEGYDYAVKVRDGGIKNPAFLPVIYEAPKQWKGMEVDYTDPRYFQDPAIWKVANPNLGVSVSLDYLRTESERAKETPGYLPTFLRLHLNVRTKQASLWLNMQRWDASSGMPMSQAAAMAHQTGGVGWGNPGDRAPFGPRASLLGRQCWAGLDIGSTSDLTSLCLLFPNEDESYEALWWNWVPEETLKKRQQRGDVIYLEASQRGVLRVTEGDETDYRVIREEINALGDQYGIQEIAIDRVFQGAQLGQDLGDLGFTVVPFGFGFLSMAAPTQELERLVNRGDFHHGGNILARWAAGNVIVQHDAANNMKPDKAKSADKIDPISAALIALGRAMVRDKDTGSVYDSRGLIVL